MILRKYGLLVLAMVFGLAVSGFAIADSSSFAPSYAFEKPAVFEYSMCIDIEEGASSEKQRDILSMAYSMELRFDGDGGLTANIHGLGGQGKFGNLQRAGCVLRCNMDRYGTITDPTIEAYTVVPIPGFDMNDRRRAKYEYFLRSMVASSLESTMIPLPRRARAPGLSWLNEVREWPFTISQELTPRFDVFVFTEAKQGDLHVASSSVSVSDGHAQKALGIEGIPLERQHWEGKYIIHGSMQMLRKARIVAVTETNILMAASSHESPEEQTICSSVLRKLVLEANLIENGL